MKTNEKLPIANCQLPIKTGKAAFCPLIGNRQSALGNRSGFTLIELLVVIAIMAILAGFTLVVVHSLKKKEYLGVATAELAMIENALSDYQAKYGVYPPSNANLPGTYAAPLTNSMFPQLYYELSGVTNKTVNGVNCYSTLDGSAVIPVTAVATAFGAGGFINCSKGSGDEASLAQNFLANLSSKQVASLSDNGIAISALVTAVRGPDLGYTPFGVSVKDVNPVRYLYPGVNNPNSYDLWVQLVISGKTNLVCNWSKQAILNSPLP